MLEDSKRWALVIGQPRDSMTGLQPSIDPKLSGAIDCVSRELSEHSYK